MTTTKSLEYKEQKVNKEFFVEASYFGIIMYVRKKDDCVNVGKLCADAGKDFAQLKKSVHWQSILEAYESKQAKIAGPQKSGPGNYTLKGGAWGSMQGEYVDRYLVHFVAEWISLDYAFLVRDMMEEIDKHAQATGRYAENVTSELIEQVQQKTEECQVLNYAMKGLRLENEELLDAVEEWKTKAEEVKANVEVYQKLITEKTQILASLQGDYEEAKKEQEQQMKELEQIGLNLIEAKIELAKTNEQLEMTKKLLEEAKKELEETKTTAQQLHQHHGVPVNLKSETFSILRVSPGVYKLCALTADPVKVYAYQMTVPGSLGTRKDASHKFDLKRPWEFNIEMLKDIVAYMKTLPHIGEISYQPAADGDTSDNFLA